MTPAISVVVPTRNRPERLAECLEHLARLDFPRDRFEVIVVDDGSREPLEGLVAAFSGRLELTLLTRPSRGPARARNAGAEQAAGRYLAFTDDDCRADPGWLGGLVERLDASPGCAVGGLVVNGLPENPWSSASQALCDYLYAYYNRDPARARFFTSNNLAIPAERFAALGGFDPAYPLAAGEDRDLCDRLASSGTPLVYEPRAVVLHAHSLDVAGFLRQHFRYGRGACRFHQTRRRRTGDRVHIEPLRFYLGLVAAPFSSTHGLRSATGLSTRLVLSQIANASGFLWETIRPSPGQALDNSRR